MNKSLKFASFCLIFLCALCWGPSYLFIKIALPEIPPITLVFLRVGIGAMILYALCLIQKSTLFQWRQNWKQYLILGIALNALPFYLISYGELYISSSLAGILNSLTLIFTSVLAHFFGTKRDPLTKNRLFGIVAGLAGLCVIYLPLILKENVPTGLGGVFIILACLSYSTGTVYAKNHLRQGSGITLLTAQLSVAALILLPCSLFIDHSYALAVPSWQPVLGAVGLGIIGTAGGFFFYYKAIQKAGITYAAFATLFVPPFAMLLGALILQEQLTWNLYVGTCLILAGVLVVNPLFNQKGG